MGLLERLLPGHTGVTATTVARDPLDDLVAEARRQNRAAWQAINARRARRGEAPLLPDTAWEDLLESQPPHPPGEG